MGYYPVYLDLRGRPCVVIGGGPEAEEKAERLVEDGARLTVVCWGESAAFDSMEAQGRPSSPPPRASRRGARCVESAPCSTTARPGLPPTP